MKEHTILVTGDYWHPDFQPCVTKFEVPVTMVPIEKIDSVKESKFDLIVIAQARRQQFSADEIEKLQSLFVNLPMVALLGSWCEGEPRSGDPWPGVTRVYWHQWEGRYDRFVSQLDSAGITHWHAPRTSSVADRVAGLKMNRVKGQNRELKIDLIGIGAWTNSQFEMVDDAVRQFGWRSRWIERAAWDGSTAQMVTAICVDANSWSYALEKRLKWIREEISDAPIILLLNYPRQDELEPMMQSGVLEVVSKPFELEDLKSAIIRAVKKHAAENSAAPVSADR